MSKYVKGTFLGLSAKERSLPAHLDKGHNKLIRHLIFGELRKFEEKLLFLQQSKEMFCHPLVEYCISAGMFL